MFALNVIFSAVFTRSFIIVVVVVVVVIIIIISIIIIIIIIIELTKKKILGLGCFKQGQLNDSKPIIF